jgi:CheY-like chemotaxis protein
MRQFVLVVETDPAVRRLIRHTLTRLGVAVRDAATGPEALAFLAADPAAVGAVVAEDVLPGFDGRTLATAVQASAPGVPIYFLHWGSLESTYLQAEGVEVFLKPHGLLEMCRAVAERLGAGGDSRTSAAAIRESWPAAPRLRPAPEMWPVAGRVQG